MKEWAKTDDTKNVNLGELFFNKYKFQVQYNAQQSLYNRYYRIIEFLQSFRARYIISLLYWF